MTWSHSTPFLLNLLCVNSQIMWILPILMRPWNRGGVVGWCESKFWNDSAAFVWKKTGSQCSSSLWRPSIEKLLVISPGLLDYWILSYSFSCCLLQAPSIAWELPQGSASRYFLLVNQSITVGLPGQGSQEKHIPVLRRAFLCSMFLFSFFFWLLSI